jgi:hypothetical protein
LIFFCKIWRKKNPIKKKKTSRFLFMV